MVYLKNKEIENECIKNQVPLLFEVEPMRIQDKGTDYQAGSDEGYYRLPSVYKYV